MVDPKSQVSENPDKNAVTRTMNAKDKKADVDRKMRFYGVLAAFREGRYPDNSQIDVSFFPMRLCLTRNGR